MKIRASIYAPDADQLALVVSAFILQGLTPEAEPADHGGWFIRIYH